MENFTLNRRNKAIAEPFNLTYNDLAVGFLYEYESNDDYRLFVLDNLFNDYKRKDILAYHKSSKKLTLVPEKDENICCFDFGERKCFRVSEDTLTINV